MLVVFALFALGTCPVRGAAQYSPAVTDRPGATVYQVRGAHGRTLYTNLVEHVPLEKRSEAAVDLSHISLNSELGRELDQHLEHEHSQLLGTKYCRELRADADTSLAQYAFRDEQPLLICAAVALLLILLTPIMARQFGGEWARTLKTGVATLVLVGLLMLGMMKANHAISAKREKAQPCERATWDKLAAAASGGKSEQTVANHAELVKALREQVQALDNSDFAKLNLDPPLSTSGEVPAR